MTQHQCNECGRHVSPVADHCYGCGSLDPFSRRHYIERNVGIALTIVMLLALVVLMSGWLMTVPPEVVQGLFQR